MIRSVVQQVRKKILTQQKLTEQLEMDNLCMLAKNTHIKLQFFIELDLFPRCVQ